MINEENITEFKPVQAVIVYKKGYSDYYLETHEIMHDGDKFIWQEGRAFLKEQLKELAISLVNESFEPIEIKGLMPENLLYMKQTFFDINMVWYLPPSKQVLYFSKDLKIKSGEVSLPGLIFSVNDKTLSVVAFKGKTKPTLKTELFKAPFFNIYDSAEVCMGNVRDSRQKKVLTDEMERWEKRFFNSNFSHFLDEQVVQPKVNLSILFKDLMKTKKPFPESALIPSPLKTLQTFINKTKK